MDINEFVKQKGDFLTAKEVKDNPGKEFIISEEPSVEVNKFNQERLHIPGKFGEEDRVFDASKTNSRIISDKLGTETKLWIGQKLSLESYRTKTSDGKMTDAINVKAVV